MNRPQGLIGDIKLSNIHVNLVTKQNKKKQKEKMRQKSYLKKQCLEFRKV